MMRGVSALFFAVAMFSLSETSLSATCNFGTLQSDRRPVFAAVIDSTKNYAIGQPISVKFGEPIIRRQAPRANYVSFPEDVVYKTGSFSNERLRGGYKYVITHEVGDIGSSLSTITLPDTGSGYSRYLFLSEEGKLCDYFGIYNTKRSQFNLIDYKKNVAIPDVAAVPAGDSSDTNGITVLLDRVDAVSISLSVRYMHNGVYEASVLAKSFDNSMNVITIVGYEIEVNSLGADGGTFTVIKEPRPPQ
jgi:hypothetical protein